MTLSLGVVPASAQDLPPGGTFVDDDGSVHEGYIEALVAEGITEGCDADHYCPSDVVTRGQMAAFITRALDLPSSDVDHFEDDDSSSFEGAIDAVAAAGLTDGCGPEAYCPDEPVTRAQMATLLRRAGQVPFTRTDYFVDDNGALFEDDINAVAEAGITAGCTSSDETLFCPDAPTLRDQMATFIGRLLRLDPTPPAPRPEPESETRTAVDPASMPVRDSIREWFPDQYERALRVADCESGLNPSAVNPRGYHGLFQIGSYYHRSSFERVTGVSWDAGIYTAYYNAQYAAHLQARQGWGPWPVCGS